MEDGYLQLTDLVPGTNYTIQIRVIDLSGAVYNVGSLPLEVPHVVIPLSTSSSTTDSSTVSPTTGSTTGQDNSTTGT